MSIDFIVKLPKSKELTTGIEYDLILVIINQLTKYAIFRPFREGFTAEDLAYVVKDMLLRNHQMPKEIISD